ncbi:MAG: methylenetetrahydrofolate--tRNA-(uracil(54)-C(5))-methyltransferase (FADH(2)-oxidizing) TrmFO [Paracoccaceae bacterium]
MAADVNIVGGGLAGAEAAWQAAEMGVKVTLHEMRPKVGTFAHKSGDLAEMVCSNSFRSDDSEQNAVGLLHWEMRQANGLIIKNADKYSLPAGGALAVDRTLFSAEITKQLKKHPNIYISYSEVVDLPTTGNWIIATGPLTSNKLAKSIVAFTGQESLAFFDAIAPIVYYDTINMEKAWFQSRYDKGETEADKKAYLNCPMDKKTYESFIENLINADKTAFKEGETANYFNGCLPIEVMAERGRDTLRFGPMKPVGLTNQHSPNIKPHAVVQLRQDNKLGTLFNIVGFQTKMKYGDQKKVFRSIPGLENAEFARLGGIHRNTFINSPLLLDDQLRLKSNKSIRFAGQITGVEGYVESAAIGLIAGRLAAAEALKIRIENPPPETAMGALMGHILEGADIKTFQPMNINFGLFPGVDSKNGRKNRPLRYKMYTDRAKHYFMNWISSQSI